MNKYIVFLLAFVAIFLRAQESQQDLLLRLAEKKQIKVLVLIIACDDQLVYRELQKVWRLYMHQYPDQIEAYFIKADPDLDRDIYIQDDVIWVKTRENIQPGILYKTIKAMEYFSPRLKTEFSYVLRPNLSSFYVFPRLLSFLESCPKKRFYGGSHIGHGKLLIGSGCGFVLSSDVASLIVRNKEKILAEKPHFDDVTIGVFLNKKGIKLTRHKRMDFFSMRDWVATGHTIGHDLFHFRVKNENELKRIPDDIVIHHHLYQIFYGATISEHESITLVQRPLALPDLLKAMLLKE